MCVRFSFLSLLFPAMQQNAEFSFAAYRCEYAMRYGRAFPLLHAEGEGGRNLVAGTGTVKESRQATARCPRYNNSGRVAVKGGRIQEGSEVRRERGGVCASAHAFRQHATMEVSNRGARKCQSSSRGRGYGRQAGILDAEAGMLRRAP